jgi:hypothetical protein
MGTSVESAECAPRIDVLRRVPAAACHLRRSLVRIGYTGNAVRSMPIKNTKEGVLYHLVFATKDPLGDKI